MRKLTGVLGLIVDKKEEILDEDIEKLIEERQAARKVRRTVGSDYQNKLENPIPCN